MRNEKKYVQNSVGIFRVPKPSHPGSIFNFVYSNGGQARKRCQNSTETFLIVLTWNDKNCTPKSVGMFRVQNRVIWARFSTLPAPVVLELEKVVKIWPKHFSTVLIGTDTNCAPNNVGMFEMQNRVIRVQFSTFPALMIPRPEKVVKILTELFFNRTDSKW